MVIIGSLKPMRVVQRARLWAMTRTASQAPLVGTARWQVVEAHAVFQVADGVLDLGVAAIFSLPFLND